MSTRVLLLGATGTIGRATARALVEAGYDVTSLVRPSSDVDALPGNVVQAPLDTDGLSQVLTQCSATAVISCLASRTGIASDAWAVDHRANSVALQAAEAADVTQFILLSAICVQKPLLAFQRAKLAFEAELQASHLMWSIVRPTAFFKSLSGQVNRLHAGKPFLLFGDGELTACKPISDADTARYLVQCLTDPNLQNRVLPIGGPGPAITPKQQGAMLFHAMGLTPQFRQVPIGIMTAIITALTPLGVFSKSLATKAELARIGRYYATESMLVWDAAKGLYDADATPEFGHDTLAEHYRQLAAGEIADNRGSHAVF
ncbi:MAG: NAD(P)H-binding protein [Pseudomonadota bacterium]